MVYPPIRGGFPVTMKGHIIEGAIAGAVTVFGALTMGAAWLNTPVCMPVGWVVVGPLALLFVPALAIVTAISRRLGVQIEVSNTNE